MGSLRILVHDYGAYPFSVQLSRELARRGYEVLYLYSTFMLPAAAVEKMSNDPKSFDVAGIGLSEPFRKNSLFKRRRQEIEYGRLLAARIEIFRPRVVISANTPLNSQAIIQTKCKRLKIRFIVWLQDVLSVGIQQQLKKKLPWLGSLVGRHYSRLERQLVQRSDAVIPITEDYLPIMSRWHVPESNIHVIGNWAPLDEIPPRPRSNRWAKEHGLVDKVCLLYSGTLGLKHDPALLVELAEHFKNRENIQVVVISEGLGADWLTARKDELNLDNLMLLEYQPYERLPEVLATGDILIAILEQDASKFSVPSKVLTYLCAGRPLLLAVPPENLAAKIISCNQAGRVVQPADIEKFIMAAEELINDSGLRARLGSNALKYSHDRFGIERIATRFEEIVLQVIA